MRLRSGVLCVRGCFFVLLDASIATSAHADSDTTPDQPRCGWDNCDFHPPNLLSVFTSFEILPVTGGLTPLSSCCNSYEIKTRHWLVSQPTCLWLWCPLHTDSAHLKDSSC